MPLQTGNLCCRGILYDARLYHAQPTDLHLSFVPKIWNRPPAFPQHMRRHFRLPVPGEDPLFVALDAHNTLTGLEVREVPDLLTDEIRKLVRNFVIGF